MYHSEVPEHRPWLPFLAYDTGLPWSSALKICFNKIIGHGHDGCSSLFLKKTWPMGERS